MRIVIDISKEDYKEVCNTVMSIEEMYGTLKGKMYGAITRGIQLPKGHGRLIDADKLAHQGYDVLVDGPEHMSCNSSMDIEDVPTMVEADKE